MLEDKRVDGLPDGPLGVADRDDDLALPNFEAARMFLTQAEDAKAAGDENKCKAACRMVMVALDLSDSSPRIHLGHLKK